jgi:glyoxylase-like metal-dependent hydrolase (beta-lactamase superfamily II)
MRSFCEHWPRVEASWQSYSLIQVTVTQLTNDELRLHFFRPNLWLRVAQESQFRVELRDVAPGLWIWRFPHPHWKPGQGWEPVVACTYVQSGGETLLLDPLAPLPDAAEVWTRLDAHPPTAVVVLKPDHVRDVDLFVRRYSARAFGPRLFFRYDVPETELQWIEPGSQLPGGLVALYDGRGRNETPLWLPEQRAIVFADALTAPGGELRVWASPCHQERALPALRALLELPFERVIVSHGEPVHTRADYERALERVPWTG